MSNHDKMPTSLWTADWSSFVEHRTARRGSPPSAFLKAAWFFIWLYQVVSYEYVTWLIMRGYKREDLGFGDFPRAQKADSAADLSDAILANWNKEVEAAAKKNRKPSMWRVIRWTFGPRYIVCVILACCEEVTKISNAILLGYILRWLRDPTASYSMGYLYAGMMMLCTLVDAVLRHFMFYISIRTGFQMRVGLIASVYRKLLQLSLSHTASTGVIVNLVSNDVQKLEDFSPFAYFLLLGPIESIIVGVILIVNIGVGPALAGLATLYLIIPIQAFFANRFSLYRKETVRIRDDRIRSTSDVLFGMNVVKLYAWEKPFEERLNEMRDDEVRFIKKANRFRAINDASYYFTTALIGLVTWGTAWGLGYTLTADKVFTTLYLFQLTRLTMANNFTKAVQFGAESMISVRRLGEFFALPEIGETEGDDGPTGASAAGESMAMLPSRRPSKAAIPMARNPSNRSLPPGMSPSISQNLGNSSAGDSPMVVVRGATFAWDVAVSTGMAKPAAAKGPEPVRQQNDGPMPVQSRALNFSIVPARRGGRPTNTGLVNFDPSAVPEQPPSNGASAPAPPLAKTVKGSTTSLVHVPKLRTILSDITLELKPGTLTAIVGPVGAGKSSSILAILGEMVTQRGFVKVNTDKVAYCPQAPWIVSGTVRDNIVFGGEYDEAKFNQVVADCALTRDLTLLPKGADSLIGERGVTLSGGQKARLSLARAVYHDADLYLLDDPLSAVDAAVGRHLFENTILARLTREKKRAVLLVTHQLQFVKHADQILVLEDGHIASRGTWADIVGDPDDPVGTPFIEVLKEFEKNAENGMDVDFDDLAEKRDGEEHQDNVQVVINEPDSEREEDDEDEDLLEDDEAEEELGKNEGTMRIERLSAAPKTPTGMARRLSLAPLPSNIDLVPLTVSDSKKKVVDGQNGTSGELPNGSGSEAPAAKSKTGEASKDEGNKEFVSEDRAVGSVKGGIYLDYFRRGGGPFAVIFLLAFLAIGEALRVSCDWWLSHWTSLSAVDQRDPRNMAIYGGLVAALMFVSLTRAFAFYTITIGSSNKLSRDALRSVLLSPLIWHQTNPHGRVLNRFSKDLNQIDEMLPLTLFDFLQCCFMIAGVLILACVLVPWVLVMVPFLAGIFWIFRRLYIRTSRQVKRLESVSRSPVYSAVPATLDGLSVIRAFRAGPRFVSRFFDLQDVNSTLYYAFISCARWVGFRLDMLCGVFLGITAFLCVGLRDTLSPGLVGLLLAYVSQLLGLNQWAVRQSTEVENLMVATERVIEYTRLPSEPAARTDVKPPPGWPTAGEVVVRDLSLTYPVTNQKVLNGISVAIQPGTKVGIVGRTGAGKSSLLSALFRLVEPDPKDCVLIDGLSTSAIGLADLRSSISIIPQEPFLFKGNLRMNVDPFNRYKDDEIWRALEVVELKDKVARLPGKLESAVLDQGSNWSVGERQLICVARAVLKNARLIVMDEATANIDLHTDRLIQSAIRSETGLFAKSTVLCIAHRLATVVDFDQIMVLDGGKLVEFGTPYELLQKSGGWFQSMVHETGPDAEEMLRKIAEDKENERRRKVGLPGLGLEGGAPAPQEPALE